MTIVTQPADALVADAYFPALRDHIISATGLVFYADRPQALAAHVGERIKTTDSDNCHAYLELLHNEPDGITELDHLISLLTIGETYFFRHRELFDALRDVALPEIIHRNRATRRLRIWSAGCSTGPEAYSVSILLRRELRHLTLGWNISILGTDINRPFLSQASEGRYEEWAFRSTSLDFRRECFDLSPRGWRIAPRFQEGVTFQYHNLVRQPFPSLMHDLLGFDLILCRNVLIYFPAEVSQRIISQLAECLVPGGWLAVGHAEHGANLLELFEAVNCPGATLYRKPAASGAASESARPQLILAAPKLLTADRAIPHSSAKSELSGRSKPTANSQHRLPSSGCAPDVEQIRSLADQGNVDAAIQMCDSLIAKHPLQPTYHFYQALLLDHVTGHEAALRALGKAIYLDREFVLAHYYLGLTQQKLGHQAVALKSFRNVLRMLAGRNETELLPDAEGMTIADLKELTRMHIETLDRP